MSRAFTLIELLVVISIIAVLAGILFPVFTTAKKAANRTVAVSHLRECGMGLTMYLEDGDLSDIPASRDTFIQALSHSPTCDPSDTWRSGCSGQVAGPLVGSFAVARLAAPLSTNDDAWAAYLQRPNPTILISIFHGTEPLLFADYENLPPLTPPTGHRPVDRIVRLFRDGSVKTSIYTVNYNADHGTLFNWYKAFLGNIN